MPDYADLDGSNPSEAEHAAGSSVRVSNYYVESGTAGIPGRGDTRPGTGKVSATRKEEE